MDQDKYVREQIEILCGYNKVKHYTLNNTTLYIFTIGIGNVEIVYHLEYFKKNIEDELHEAILTGFKNQEHIDCYCGTLEWCFEIIINRLKIEDEK